MKPTTVESTMLELAHSCDGPPTGFVVLMRALRAAAAGGDVELLGNAVYDTLFERGIDIDGGGR